MDYIDIGAGVINAIIKIIIVALKFLFDVTNPNSVIMILYNFIPVVGSHPLSLPNSIMLIVIVGVVIGYVKFYR